MTVTREKLMATMLRVFSELDVLKGRQRQLQQIYDLDTARLSNDIQNNETYLKMLRESYNELEKPQKKE